MIGTIAKWLTNISVRTCALLGLLFLTVFLIFATADRMDDTLLNIPSAAYELVVMYIETCLIAIGAYKECSAPYKGKELEQYTKWFVTRIDFYYVLIGVIGAGIVFVHEATGQLGKPIFVVSKYALFAAVSLRGSKAWIDVMAAVKPIRAKLPPAGGTKTSPEDPATSGLAQIPADSTIVRDPLAPMPPSVPVEASPDGHATTDSDDPKQH